MRSNQAWVCLLLLVIACTREQSSTELPSPAPRISLTATPADVKPGEPVTLRWESTWDEPPVLQGHGPVEPTGTMVVRPAADTIYSITIGDPPVFGAVVEVRMIPTLEPAGGVIHVGTSQTFSLRGIPEPIDWERSGGQFREAGIASVRWTAPQEPGSYTISAEAADGRRATATVEVRRLEGPAYELLGIGGQAAPNTLHGPGSAVVASRSGDVYVSSGYVVLHGNLAKGTWEAVGRISPGPGSLALAPDGTLWHCGTGLSSFDPVTRSWRLSDGCSGAARIGFADDGTLVASGRTGLRSRSPGAQEWLDLPAPPGDIRDAEIAPSGAVVVLLGDGWGPGSIQRLPAGGAEWELLGTPPPELDDLQLAPEGGIYVGGYGLGRLVDGAWEDLAEGLPRDCPYESPCRLRFAVRGDAIYAATHGGLFERLETGSFVRIDDIPYDFDPASRLLDAGDELVMVGAGGTYRRTWEGTGWRPLQSSEGLPAATRVVELASGPDGLLFAGAHASYRDAAPLYRREPGGAWMPLAAELRGDSPGGPAGILPQADGSIVFAFDGAVHRIPSGGDRAEPFESEGLEGYVRGLDGAPGGTLLAGTDAGVFLLAPGASRWTALPPPPAPSSGVVAGTGDILAITTEGTFVLDESGSWSALGTGGPTGWVQGAVRAPDGTLWLHGAGTWRLANERWERVGLGGCGDGAVALGFGADGVPLCIDGNREVFRLHEANAWVPVVDQAWNYCLGADALAADANGRIHVAIDGAGVFVVE